VSAAARRQQINAIDVLKQALSWTHAGLKLPRCNIIDRARRPVMTNDVFFLSGRAAVVVL
jgi:hypothetical protein